MKRLQITASNEIDLSGAQQKARGALSEDKDLSLVAWYDRGRRTGGPAEPCGDEPEKCVRDYARQHGAEIDVSVNNGAYEFFFASKPGDVVELDREQALKIHKDTKNDDYDDTQGG